LKNYALLLRSPYTGKWQQPLELFWSDNVHAVRLRLYKKLAILIRSCFTPNSIRNGCRSEFPEGSISTAALMKWANQKGGFQPSQDERGNVIGVVSANLSAAAALKATGELPENVNYAVKSSFLLGFLESVPEVVSKLKDPNTSDMQSEEVVEKEKAAAVLVLVY
jgi:hypothetical protein